MKLMTTFQSDLRPLVIIFILPCTRYLYIDMIILYYKKILFNSSDIQLSSAPVWIWVKFCSMAYWHYCIPWCMITLLWWPTFIEPISQLKLLCRLPRYLQYASSLLNFLLWCSLEVVCAPNTTLRLIWHMIMAHWHWWGALDPRNWNYAPLPRTEPDFLPFSRSYMTHTWV